jgi:anti-anti-sigma factor
LEAEVLDTAAGVEVRLRGHAGVLEVDALDFVLRPLSARRPACVTFELSKLESISSLGMGLLVAFRRGIVRAGGRVCLAADLQPGVREALDRTGLMSLFEGVGTAKAYVPPAAADVRNAPPVPSAAGNSEQQKTVRPHEGQAAAGPTGRRFNWVAVGFWLGGLALGTAGCVLGACMPYRHPVGVALSVFWWGVYLGCLGASIGAGAGGLFGPLWDRSPASAPRAGDRAQV